MLGQIVKKVAKIIAGCFVASSVSALDFSEQTYEVYFGDFNRDGNRGDVYFHEKDKFVLIHGDIAIPLSIAGNGSYVVYESGDGTAVSLKLQVSQLNGYTKGVLGQDYSFGDVNGDGFVDLTASVSGSATRRLVLLGSSTGVPVVKSTSSSGASPIAFKFTYDALGRLRVVKENGEVKEGYQYDKVGNFCKISSEDVIEEVDCNE